MSASCVPAVRFSDCSLRGGTAAPVIQMVWQAGFAGLETLVVGGWESVVGSWAVTSICYLPFWGFCIPFLFFFAVGGVGVRASRVPFLFTFGSFACGRGCVAG